MIFTGGIVFFENHDFSSYILQTFADRHHFIGRNLVSMLRCCDEECVANQWRLATYAKSYRFSLMCLCKPKYIGEPENIFHRTVRADILKQYCDRHR